VDVDPLGRGEMPFGAGRCGDEGELTYPLVRSRGEDGSTALRALTSFSFEDEAHRSDCHAHPICLVRPECLLLRQTRSVPKGDAS